MSNFTTKKGDDAFNLRLPDGMRGRIHDEAKRNGRSANAEIVARLDASFHDFRSLNHEVATLLESHIQQEITARLKASATTIGETR